MISLVPRPSLPPVFDCLHYTRTEGMRGSGGGEGLGTRLAIITMASYPVESDGFLDSDPEPEGSNDSQSQVAQSHTAKYKHHQPAEVLLLLNRVSEGWDTLVYNKAECEDS